MDCSTSTDVYGNRLEYYCSTGTTDAFEYLKYLYIGNEFIDFVKGFNLPMRLWPVIAGKMKGFYRANLNRRIMPDGKCLIKRRRRA